jgi:sulfite reductase alpha subunit
MADDSSKTKLLDDLEQGPWPSFVKEIKKASAAAPACEDLLGQLELSYEERKGHWKHGGIVGVRGYGGGVIGRYSDVPEQFPQVAHFHTMRVNHPAGWFYTSDALRKLADIWERHGSSLTNLHGATGDIILLGTRSEELEPAFKELTEAGFDLGGSGSALRTPSACVGPARCEWACYDTLATCYNLTQHYQDELHRPAFPYKFKIKCSGCPNDCVASIARADLSIIGTWKDDIRQDDEAVSRYAAEGLDIQKEVCDHCPSKCMAWDGAKLTIESMPFSRVAAAPSHVQVLHALPAGSQG